MIFRYMIAGGTAAAFDLAFFLTFSTWLGYNYLVIGGVGFFFQNGGPLNSWLFWLLGLFFAEAAVVIARFWKERRGMLS